MSAPTFDLKALIRHVHDQLDRAHQKQEDMVLIGIAQELAAQQIPGDLVACIGWGDNETTLHDPEPLNCTKLYIQCGDRFFCCPGECMSREEAEQDMGDETWLTYREHGRESGPLNIDWDTTRVRRFLPDAQTSLATAAAAQLTRCELARMQFDRIGAGTRQPVEPHQGRKPPRI